LQQQMLAREVDEIPWRMGWDFTWHLVRWCCPKAKTRGYDRERTTWTLRSSVGKRVRIAQPGLCITSFRE